MSFITRHYGPTGSTYDTVTQQDVRKDEAFEIPVFSDELDWPVRLNRETARPTTPAERVLIFGGKITCVGLSGFLLRVNY